ncbi:hypothetical protein N474_11325 [Pseudoalteromonas luteoviolacea CPMOR-2]|uniref:ABC-type glycine betaine transport system substrate-binding domain-containing protein n=1 Tax=Pseudoalteromonas luteoviolacea DSM 6061 TaxID=1365250 RepID=A0A166V8I5_9GAMM|nr:ABC transporter substrate-binding protein [Pseudoalteromonas luteoviolacea]KZN32366.1 hypothetical protein N475_22050 [Pseudoalteromonas luteoviolacea DSM 6061]KZN56736.1 hypothetical protein N474_11325 [Pseudoalteromonas luteoviolacea CPMOR-2]MBE0386121.1 glycine betaine/proline transport system substrate-binding protein [Pseudoalteromonas luteoviolacea DSM 6061]
MNRCLIALALLASSHFPASSQPIRVVVNDWSSQRILANIAGEIFLRLGYEVELINISVDVQWYLLKTNRVDLQLEIWEGTMEDKYEQLHQAGDLIDLGDYSVTTREDWWYPLYVKSMCPGLPDWKALKQCFGIFASPSSRGKGVYIAGPWEKPDRARIKALGLNFIVEQVNDDTELWKQLKQAVSKRKPVLIFNWTPNWVGAVYPGEFVEFPEHSVECETEPEWGINSTLVHDCGNPKSGWLKKVSSRRFVKLFPCLAQSIERFDLTNEEIEQLSAQVNRELLSPKQVAQRWVKSHRKRWEQLFSECKAPKLKTNN